MSLNVATSISSATASALSSSSEVHEFPSTIMLAVSVGFALIPLAVLPVLMLKFLPLKWVVVEEIIAACALAGIGALGVYWYWLGVIAAADYFLNICGFSIGVLGAFIAEFLLVKFDIIKIEAPKGDKLEALPGSEEEAQSKEKLLTK